MVIVKLEGFTRYPCGMTCALANSVQKRIDNKVIENFILKNFEQW
jgi:hypothetical protein